jgi:hypothetical protein
MAAMNCTGQRESLRSLLILYRKVYFHWKGGLQLRQVAPGDDRHLAVLHLPVTSVDRPCRFVRPARNPAPLFKDVRKSQAMFSQALICTFCELNLQNVQARFNPAGGRVLVSIFQSSP